MSLRLRLFWRKTILGNGFTAHRVFGCAWKIEFSKKQFHLTMCFMALTQKIFYTSIFPSKDFQTQTRRERERERERERARRETRESEIGLVPLSSNHRPKASLSLRREITLGRSSCRDCISLDASWARPTTL